jgi:signal transduction histidine kinase
MLKRISFQFRITFLYIVFGALWILYSDRLMMSMTSDPHRIQQLSTWKGWLYVLATGIMLFFLVRHEIRRRNQVIRELREAKARADEAVRLKTTFLSNLSHYIRTPMNSILGFIELIEDKDTSPENHAVFLSYVNESSENLLQTLTSIIEISKIQEGHAIINPSSLHLNELIERAAGMARVAISEKKKDVKVITHPGLPDDQDLITSDPEKISLILTNLVSNAVRFTPKGQIEIGYSTTANQCQVRVSDTGPGISAEKQPYLFSDFLHNTEATSTKGEGSGLGLTLAYRLAKLLGGDLWLDKTSNQGSTFCLSLVPPPAVE